MLKIDTKKEFYSALSEKTGLSQKKLKEVMTAVQAILVESATSADETKTIIPEIGTLVVKPRPAYQGFNPKTGEPTLVKASKSINIRVTAPFKKAIRS